MIILDISEDGSPIVHSWSNMVVHDVIGDTALLGADRLEDPILAFFHKKGCEPSYVYPEVAKTIDWFIDAVRSAITSKLVRSAGHIQITCGIVFADYLFLNIVMKGRNKKDLNIVGLN